MSEGLKLTFLVEKFGQRYFIDDAGRSYIETPEGCVPIGCVPTKDPDAPRPLYPKNREAAK